MRDYFLVTAITIGLGFTVRYPFVGVLIWEWFSLMAPHQQAYGFARSIPLNLIVAIVTLVSWIASKEPKKIPSHSIIVLLVIFLVWTTFNSFFAFDPDWSWQYWNRTWRIFVLGFVVSAMATNKVRVDAIIWVAVISLFYYGVKGGIFTIESGGSFRVYGPDDTIIADNNQLALALLMALPLAEYLRTNVESRLLSWLLTGSMAATAVSVLGSYSRGAYVAMAGVALFALFHARRRFVYLAAMAIVMLPALYFMPQSFYSRVSSMNSLDTDASFHGRWVAWQVAFRYATDHFPFGAGFYGPQLHALFNSYFPLESAHAAHSIYFQVLGEHGFIGLVIYLTLLTVSFLACSLIHRRAKRIDAKWMQKLAQMIQVSLVAFYVGGAALSMAYYDLFIVLICLLPKLNEILGELERGSGMRLRWRASETEAVAAQ